MNRNLDSRLPNGYFFVPCIINNQNPRLGNALISLTTIIQEGNGNKEGNSENPGIQCHHPRP